MKKPLFYVVNGRVNQNNIPGKQLLTKGYESSNVHPLGPFLGIYLKATTAFNEH